MSEYHKSHPEYGALGIFAGYGECADMTDEMKLAALTSAIYRFPRPPSEGERFQVVYDPQGHPVEVEHLRRILAWYYEDVMSVTPKNSDTGNDTAK